MNTPPVFRTIAFLFFCLLLSTTQLAYAQDAATSKEQALYTQIKSFALIGGAVEVKDLVLKKDRTQITLNGTVQLTGETNGQITGAVFMGEGKFALETPPSEFEKNNIKRLLGTDVIESDFKTAVFRFSDDTAQFFGQPKAGAVNPAAQKLANDFETRILRETGANISGRLALSILNQEKPGFFLVTFDGGKRGRFSFVLDHQGRIPVANFDINAGEKGLVFGYSPTTYSTEVWAAFYSLQDYQNRLVEYSDVNNLIDVKNYDMDVDLRDHKKRVRLVTRMSGETKLPNVRAVNFKIGEDLPEEPNWRLTKQMKVKSVKLDGTALAFAQEDWEGGFTVFFPAPLAANSKFALDLEIEGDIMYDAQSVNDCHYPRSNESWFPRHGYLDRATFNMTYHHPKKLKVASVGARISEGTDPDDKDAVVAKYQMPLPIPLVTFALGPFERHPDTVKWEKGGTPTPLEFNSLSGDYAAIKEDFILAELNNSVRYFTALFGDYPYPSFSAAFHPFNFGQGFPSLLMIPPTDRANKRTYQFIAHETAHQWWGGIVAWRSYRDQWLSEGFAEYSGILYTALRESQGAKGDLLGELRSSLRDPPQTETGVGKGRLVDVGPIILGHRLSTKKTQGAYQALIYNKGALVLRMLHFMLSDPSNGDGKAFFAMMSDFVDRYRNQTASTDDFREVVNEHFARTPISKKYGMPDLNWLFKQMVYQTALPSYELQYQLVDQPDGKCMITGAIVQQNAPADWVMVLPLRFQFGNNQVASGTVLVQGPSSPFQIRLPLRPKKVELDPDHWIVADKISTTAK
jgi:hypothetical protein